jgi:hypothetical protein
MAAGKSSQSNTSLVALVVFIILFLIRAIVATIFYTKFEDQKVLTSAANDAVAKLASTKELPLLDSDIVGRTKSGTTYIGAMNGYLDGMIMTIVGNLPEATAATKVNDANRLINETINSLGEDASALFGQEGFDLLQTIIDLKSKLDAARNESNDRADTIVQINEDMEIERTKFMEDK